MTEPPQPPAAALREALHKTLDLFTEPGTRYLKDLEDDIMHLIQQHIKACDTDLRKWVEYNKHDMGEMGEFIRTKYVYNKLDHMKQAAGLDREE